MTDKRGSAADDYVTLDARTQGEQRHYDVIQLDHRRHDAAGYQSHNSAASADYESLSEQAQPQQPHYDVLQPATNTGHHTHNYENLAASTDEYAEVR